MPDETAPDLRPDDYDGADPTDTSPNGAMLGDPEIELSQDPEDVYVDAEVDDDADED